MPLDRDCYFSIDNFASNYIRDTYYTSLIKYRSSDIRMQDSDLLIIGVKDVFNPNILTFYLPVVLSRSVSDLATLFIKSFSAMSSVLTMTSEMLMPIGNPNMLKVKLFIKNKYELETICKHIRDVCYDISGKNMRSNAYSIKNVSIKIMSENLE